MLDIETIMKSNFVIIYFSFHCSRALGIEINKINGPCFLIYFFAKSCFFFFSNVVVAIPDFCLDNSKYFLLVGTKLIRAALQYLFNLVNRSTNIGGKYITHTCTCHYVRISFIETTYPAPSHVCFSP